MDSNSAPDLNSCRRASQKVFLLLVGRFFLRKLNFGRILFNPLFLNVCEDFHSGEKVLRSVATVISQIPRHPGRRWRYNLMGVLASGSWCRMIMDGPQESHGAIAAYRRPGRMCISYLDF
jgi:hypothetical protein